MIDPNSPEAKTYINSMETQPYKELLLKEAEDKLKTVKVILYIIAAIQLIVGIVFYFMNKENALYVVIIQVIVAIIFFGLALLVNKKPKLGVISALTLYAGLILLNAIYDTSSIYSGLIIKAAVIYAFVKGITAAKEVEALREKIGQIDSGENMPMDMV